MIVSENYCTITWVTTDSQMKCLSLENLEKMTCNFKEIEYWLRFFGIPWLWGSQKINCLKRKITGVSFWFLTAEKLSSENKLSRKIWEKLTITNNISENFINFHPYFSDPLWRSQNVPHYFQTFWETTVCFYYVRQIEKNETAQHKLSTVYGRECVRKCLE